MRFEIEAKVLKTAIDKVSAVVPKKASMYCLMAYYFFVRNGEIYLTGTDVEHTLEVRLCPEWVEVEDGEQMSIDIETIKILSKATDYVTIEKVDDKCQLTYGKRNVKVPLASYNLGDLPESMLIEPMISADFTVEYVESWLLETLISLSVFQDVSEAQPMFGAFNFNLTEGRVEALDGHRIGMRQCEKGNESFMLSYKATKVMSKCLDKKGTDKVNISVSKNFIYIEGCDFRYKQRRLEGTYYQVSRMLTSDFNTACTCNVKEMADACKYAVEVIIDANSRKPIIFDLDKELKVGAKTIKGEFEDTIESKVDGEPLKIAFNPRFILDVCGIVKTDELDMKFISQKAPMIAESEDYKFLLLPVNFNNV